MAEQKSLEQVLEELTRRAEEMWGAERAAALQGALQDTARQVWEVRSSVTEDEVEPGFFQ